MVIQPFDHGPVQSLASLRPLRCVHMQVNQAWQQVLAITQNREPAGFVCALPHCFVMRVAGCNQVGDGPFVVYAEQVADQGLNVPQPRRMKGVAADDGGRVMVHIHV